MNCRFYIYTHIRFNNNPTEKETALQAADTSRHALYVLFSISLYNPASVNKTTQPAACTVIRFFIRIYLNAKRKAISYQPCHSKLFRCCQKKNNVIQYVDITSDTK